MEKTIFSSANNHLVKWLKKARVDKKVSQRELAAKIDSSYTIVTKIESQDRKLDIIEYIIYCRALEVDPQEGLLIAMKEVDKLNHLGSKDTK